jgi:hypothetical protein
MLDNFKKGYSGDYGVELTPQKLWRVCEIDWVSLKVGCPEVSLDRENSHRVYQVVTGMPSHPDQFSYIDIHKRK